MPRRKQDWSPRAFEVDLQDVTLHYNRLPKEWPAAQDLIEEMRHETDPRHLVETYDYDKMEAVAESRRMRGVLEAYERGEWYYIELKADTITRLPHLSDRPWHLATDGDILSSDMPKQAFVVAELTELEVLHGLLQDRDVFARSFRVIRIGGYWVPHTGFKSDWEARIRFDKQGKVVRS